MDLREFIEKAKEIGELKIIEGADCHLEIGAIAHLMGRKPHSPALLFDKIPGYKPGYRILVHPFNSRKRSNLILGLPLQLRGQELISTLRDKLNEPIVPVPPVEVQKGPIMQNMHRGDEIDLFMFPTPKWLAGDGGRYIGTGDTVITRDPDKGWINVGVHRIQIHDKSTATIFHESGKHGDMIRRKYWSKGKSCPVAVTLGGDPYHISIGGISKSTWGTSEYDYIGWWRKKAVEVIKGPVTGLPIPADAEIVFEGEMVPPQVESRIEGPFAEWTGHYSPPKPESAFKVKCVLHRDNPIILAVLPFLGVGAPGASVSQPDLYLWHHLDKLVPGVKGVWTRPEFGGPHAVVISIEQLYGGHAKEVALAALGYYNYNKKFIIVVDDDIDPSNLNEVLFAVGMRSSPESWDIVRDCWCGSLDPLLSPQKREVKDFTHSAVMILACKPYHWIKDFPARVKSSPELEERVKEKWPDLL
jgi:4-hydroxy-3-polyprenylbenzoate decarboxylase